MKRRLIAMLLALALLSALLPAAQLSAYAALSLSQADFPAYPQDGQTYWVVFNEGYRSGRVELSTCEISGDAENAYILWNKSLRLQNASANGRYNQYYYDDATLSWIKQGTYGLFTDYATDIIASNLDIYNASGELVLKKTDYVGSAMPSYIPAAAGVFNGHAYMVYNDADTYAEAQNKCVDRGGHLATITSAEENEFVYNYIRSLDVYNAYFGFTDERDEGTWEWVTGEPAGYTNWKPGEPNGENANEDYAMFYYKFDAGEWNDGDFGGSTVDGGKNYICEWDTTSIDNLSCCEYELATTLKDGDEVVIYNAAAGRAMSERAVYNQYRAAVAVTVNNNRIITRDSGIVWKVTKSGTGYKFTNDAGETLSATKGLSFADTDNVWAINPAKTADSVYLVSTTATGTSGDPKYVEWYDKYNEFTTYYYSETSNAIFAMQLFVKTGNVITVTPSDIPTEPTISSEITHLIFSDMAYQQFKESDEGKTVYQYVVNENHGSLDPLYENSSFCQRDAFKLLGDWTIKEVDYGEANNKAAGYASVAFQKGNELIIAYRGSENGLFSIFTEDADWDVDLQFALYNYLNPDQFEAALRTYNKLAGKGYNITLTGHSLGGALATYVSIITGTKAYTFDGADGHVVDLSYYVGFREIDFHGKEEMNFVNYTDDPSPKNGFADLIQAMNTEYYYGNYYKYNDDHIHPGSYWAVPAHFIYSITRLSSDGKTIEFTDLLHTKAPKKNWKMTFMNGFSFPDYTDSDISRRTTRITVTLGTTNADRLKGTPSEVYVPKRLKTMKNVMYGGDGADTLIGAGESTIFIPGRLEGDHLTGGMGSDYYYLDCQNGGNVYISDQSGYDIIQLKNVDGFTSAGAVYQGKENGWHLFTIGGVVNVYIKEKGRAHWYSVVAPTGTEICRLSAKDGVLMTGGGGGGRGKEVTVLENNCKEVSIDGDVTIRIFNSNGELVDTISSSSELVSNCSYGDVIVTNDEEGKHLCATVYDNYRIEVSGNEISNISIFSADEGCHVDRVAFAENVDLSKGDAVLELSEQSITQNDGDVVTNEICASTAVAISFDQLKLEIGQEADLSALLLRDGNEIEGNVCWQTDSPSVVRYVEKEGGTCSVEALSAGTATVYAVAEDSGYYAICTVTVVEHNTHQAADAVKENRVDPTCTENGGFDTVTYCSVCGAELSRTHTNLSALGHDYVNGVCTRCGEIDPGFAQTEVPGDVNGDGDVDTVDAIRLAKFLVDLVELTDEQIAAADVTGDGDVTTTDAIRIAKYLVGLVESLKPEPSGAEAHTRSGIPAARSFR